MAAAAKGFGALAFNSLVVSLLIIAVANATGVGRTRGQPPASPSSTTVTPISDAGLTLEELVQASDPLSSEGSGRQLVALIDPNCRVCLSAMPDLLRFATDQDSIGVRVISLVPPGDIAADRLAKETICAAGPSRLDVLREFYLAAVPATPLADESCLGAAATIERIQAQTSAASRLPLRGTPTFVLDDVVVTGYRTGEPIEDQLARHTSRDR